MIMGMQEVDYAWFLATPALRLICDNLKGKSVIVLSNSRFPGILDMQIPTDNYLSVLSTIIEPRFKAKCIEIVLRRKDDIEKVFNKYQETPLTEAKIEFLNSEFRRHELLRVANGDKPLYKIAEEIFEFETPS